jgi:hypothetical protein
MNVRTRSRCAVLSLATHLRRGGRDERRWEEMRGYGSRREVMGSRWVVVSFANALLDRRCEEVDREGHVEDDQAALDA